MSDSFLRGIKRAAAAGHGGAIVEGLIWFLAHQGELREDHRAEAAEWFASELRAAWQKYSAGDATSLDAALGASRPKGAHPKQRALRNEQLGAFCGPFVQARAAGESYSTALQAGRKAAGVGIKQAERFAADLVKIGAVPARPKQAPLKSRK